MPVKTVDLINEYAKFPELKQEDVVALQQWVAKQPHLPALSELQLLLFLHSCYCKLEPTKTTIDAYFTIKTHFTDVFANRDPNLPSTTNSMDLGVFAQLPQRTPEGYRVLFYSFFESDPSKFVPADLMKLFDMSISLWLQEDGTAEGLLFVVDMKNVSLGHVARLNLFSMKNFFAYLQEALPVRLKGMHLVNAGTVAEKFLSLVKPFIKAELNEMLYLHADIGESFYKFVPQSCLPEEYGGNAGSIRNIHDLWKKKLVDNANFFIEDEQIKADESKRLEKNGGALTTVFGMDGSFKTLEVD